MHANAVIWGIRLLCKSFLSQTRSFIFQFSRTLFHAQILEKRVFIQIHLLYFTLFPCFIFKLQKPFQARFPSVFSLCSCSSTSIIRKKHGHLTSSTMGPLNFSRSQPESILTSAPQTKFISQTQRTGFKANVIVSCAYCRIG